MNMHEKNHREFPGGSVGWEPIVTAVALVAVLVQVDPWLGNFHMLWSQPKKKKKESQRKIFLRTRVQKF